MKPQIVLAALCLFSAHPTPAAESPAQGTERDAVVKVVQEFFDALHAKDAARLRATCQPGAQFTSTRPGADGTQLIRQRAVEVDAEQIAASKDDWLERMWSPTVHVSGRIAVLWTRYDFHRNRQMSHNGTDCFTLLKTDAGWKIVSAAYTVEPSDKSQHPAGSPK